MPAQLRFECDLTGEEYVNQKAWQDANLARCPLHPNGRANTSTAPDIRRVGAKLLQLGLPLSGLKQPLWQIAVTPASFQALVFDSHFRALVALQPCQSHFRGNDWVSGLVLSLTDLNQESLPARMLVAHPS